MAQLRININSSYNRRGFNQAQRDAQRMRRLQERMNKAVLQETREQIRARQRLLRLTRRLEAEERKRVRAAERRRAVFRRQVGTVAGGAIGAGAAAGAIAISLANDAAAVERLAIANEGLAATIGASSESIVQDIQRASNFTISRYDALRTANQALLTDVVQSQEQFTELTQIAITLGRAMGIDARQSIEDLTLGIANNSRERLNNLGIIISSTQGQIDANAVIEAGRRRMEELGGVVDDNASKTERITARWADLRVELGELVEQGGILDLLADGLEQGIEAADGLQSAIGDTRDILEAQRAVSTETQQQAIYWRILGLDALEATKNIITGNEELAESFVDLKRRQEELGESGASPVADPEEAMKALDLQREFAKNLLDIDQNTQRNREQEWERYFDKEQDLWKTNQDRLADIQEKGAKDLAQIDRDLQRDLERLNRQESRDIQRARQRQQQQEKQDRQRRQIDAIADQRLFDFELRNLAAEGEFNRIRELQERREIELQIERDKAQAQEQIESQQKDDEIQRIRETAEERRRQLRESASEDKQLTEERLREQVIAENESYQERLAKQREYRDERLQELEESGQEAVEALGREFAQMEDLTGTQLDSIREIAARKGVEIGQALGRGIAFGYEQNVQIVGLLGQGSATQGLAPLGQRPFFQQGGIVPGPLGQPQLVVAHGGEMIGRPQNNINVNLSASGGVSETQVNAAFQDFLDNTLIPMLSG